MHKKNETCPHKLCFPVKVNKFNSGGFSKENKQS